MILEGRTCIVTGAAGGFGRRLVVRFWQEGASLLLTSRRNEALQALADSLPAAPSGGQKVATFSGDLSETGVACRLVARAREEFATLTILVNNAAIQGPIGPIWDNDLREWESTFRINLFAPALLCALVLPWMLSKSYGKIINISGGGATAGRPRFSAYSSSKAGLVRLTETLAGEVGAAGIGINAIAPGVMYTGMLDEILAEGPDRAGPMEFEKTRRYVGRGDAAIGKATDLATFLASSESDGITGKLISAVWDEWQDLPKHKAELRESDIYTLRRIVPKDHGLDWNDK
jgi:NAD(P)-dependent dehydrogenase (short-subunit alcohol dehydrogenase family)